MTTTIKTFSDFRTALTEASKKSGAAYSQPRLVQRLGDLTREDEFIMPLWRVWEGEIETRPKHQVIMDYEVEIQRALEEMGFHPDLTQKTVDLAFDA